MSENDMILRLVKALALYYPILVDCALPFTRLLTIIVPKGSIQLAKTALDSFLCSSLSPVAANAQIEAALSTAHSGPILIPSHSAIREARSLEHLASLVQSGYVNQQEIQALPVVLTDEQTILDEENQRFFLFLEEPFAGGEIPLEELLVSDEEVSHIIQRFPDLEAGLGTEQRALTAASWFLASAYPELGDEFAALVERICEAEELCRESKGMEEGFVRVLNDWQKDNDFTDVHEVNEIIEDLDAVREHGILYTDEYFYLPEKLFCTIVQPLTQSGIPILALKNALREQKLLLPDRSRNSYTVKISVMNEYGEQVRIRMLRMDRSRLREPGEMDLIDACRTRARRKHSSGACGKVHGNHNCRKDC